MYMIIMIIIVIIMIIIIRVVAWRTFGGREEPWARERRGILAGRGGPPGIDEQPPIASP